MQWFVDNAIVILAILGCIGALGTFATFMLKFGLKVGEWKGTVDTDRNAFKTFMQEIKDDIKTILLRLPQSTTGHSSPIQLTELGGKVVDMVKPHGWIEDYATGLLNDIQSDDMSLYQIQEHAFSFAESGLLSRLQTEKPEVVKAIENCAFHHGISIGEVMKALGVVLRDKIFQLQGLSIEDI